MSLSHPLELILVMPVYNEGANIARVIGEWLPVLDGLKCRYGLLAINDGSKDGTLSILQSLASRHPGIVTVIDKPNTGHGRSCRFGYELATQSPAQWVLQIDSDGQCDPSFFPAFWARREEADCVFGVRASRGDGFARHWISRLCSVLSSLAAGVNVGDANVPYRLLRTTVLAEALAAIPADFDVQNIALTVALKRRAGLRWRYIPIHFRDRQGGVNSIDLPKVVQMGWRMLRELRRVKHL